MPRITYHDRFAALLAKDYITSRDRTFAESLYSHYKRKGSLTTGRRRCFVQMEERYATRPTPKPGVGALDSLLKNIETATGTCKGWNYTFVTSLQSQLRAGRSLSPRQNEILAKVKREFGAEAMESRVAWASEWTDEKAERYGIMMQYYSGGNTYYQNWVSQWQANKELTPSKAQYDKITGNKYAAKIFAGWYGAPRFAAGTMVALSATTSYHVRAACKSNLALVVKTNAAVPTSASARNKIYSILPVGSTKTVLVREKDLKNAPKSKKKSKK